MHNNLNFTSDTIYFSKELCPRRSCSPQIIRCLFIVSIVLVTPIGLVFAYIGAWPVFGFFGLELLALNTLIYYHYHYDFIVEKILITEDHLRVVRTLPSGQKYTWAFQRHWLQVNLQDNSLKNSHLELRSHGRAILVGSFLTSEERLNLATWLRNSLNSIESTKLHHNLNANLEHPP